MDLLSLQPNKPLANLSDYVILCYGVGKSGKTTLFFELAREHFNGDLSKALLVATEKGYKALPNVFAVDINSWSDAEKLATQLIEEKENLSFEWLGIDTLDYLYEYCVEHVVKKERIARKDSKIQNISDIAWGQGWAMVDTLITKWLNKLISAGYGIFMITHEGTKKFTSRDGTEFDKTTLSLPTRVRNSIINMCDFIIYISVEKVKDGDELRDNRVIYLRSDSDIEAGSRFQNLPETIPYNAKDFLEAFSTAVLNIYGDDMQAVVEAREVQAIEKQEHAKEFIEAETKKVTELDKVQTIGEAIKNMSKEIQDEVKAKFKEAFGSVNYKKFKDEQLEKAIELLENMKD
jgi:hypothetical protein